MKHAFTPWRRVKASDAPVIVINITLHQTRVLERTNESRHGWRLDLFRGSQFAQRDGSGIDDHGQCREPRPGKASLDVFTPQPAQELDGEAVPGIGQFIWSAGIPASCGHVWVVSD